MAYCSCTNSHYGDDSTVCSRRPGAYPFQALGPRTAFEVNHVREGLFARVDMPGVKENEVKVYVKDKKTVFFKGEARTEYRDNPRTYHGSFDLFSHSGEIRTEMKNGVLRILAPAEDNPSFSNPSSSSSVFTQIVPKSQSSEGRGTIMNNPFQCKGPTAAFEKLITRDDRMFARIDMPGVEKETVEVWVEKGRMVYFKGEAPKLWEYEEGARTYIGQFALGCHCCRFTDNVISFVGNGVVKMLISKIKIM